jgi:hypothetical protein
LGGGRLTTEGALAATASALPSLGAARSGAAAAHLQLRGAAAVGRSAVAAAAASGKAGASSERAAAEPPSYAAFYPLFEQRFEQWAREHPTEEPRRRDFADCLPHHTAEWPAAFDFAALGFSRLAKRKQSFAANVFMCFCMTAAATTMTAEQFAASTAPQGLTVFARVIRA